IIAQSANKQLYKLNATTASTADIKAIVEQVNTLGTQKGILLYLDEIQYFNKKQQQTLLEFIENGSITLIASTTENPYFYVYNAILSRSTVFEFKTVSAEEIIPAVERAFRLAEADMQTKIRPEPGAARAIAYGCGGDVRRAINAVELALLSAEVEADGGLRITTESIRQLSQKSTARYDKGGDEHYDILSAFQKSMRGSDPDAALHYLARLLEADDLPSACRRLLVCACEDVGLAYPQIIPIVKAAVDTALQVGLPEARIPLADAVVLVATSPKSNSAYLAMDRAIADIRAGKSGPIPRQLQNKHCDGADNSRPGQFYCYAHDYPHHWVRQQYLPDTLKDAVYYEHGDNKNEQAAKAYWDIVKKR
ncbi:MAG: replication-associated recombination protein A, partial [Clostridia bacterium]|nr:replication-associated recombination protein A [Clostridia bacterium]